MSTTTPYFSTVITFEIAKLFDFCKLKSLYSASAQDANGVTQEKNFAITDNEYDIFTLLLKDAASRVYDQVSQDAKIVQGPFQYDVDGKIIYSLMVHGDWDQAQAFPLHSAIEISLANSVMADWYKLRGNINLYQPAQDSFTQSIASVKSILNRRVTPAKTTYRYV